jgi:hypothetical protein
MSRRRIAALALSGALLAGGTTAAIAAVTKDDPDKSEQAILADAAKRLNVTPEKLRDALSAAQDAQLDEAVKAGKLTQKQADLIKEHRNKAGLVLGNKLFMGRPGMELPFGPGEKPSLRGGHVFGPHRLLGGVFPDIAKAIGITGQQLRDGLRSGKSIADLAKAQGKSLDDVRASLKADAKTAADKAVKDGDLTRSQADKMLAHLDEMVAHLGDKRMLPRGFHRGKGPDLEPGNHVLPDPPKPPEGPMIDGIFN